MTRNHRPLLSSSHLELRRFTQNWRLRANVAKLCDLHDTPAVILRVPRPPGPRAAAGVTAQKPLGMQAPRRGSVQRDWPRACP